MSEHKPINMPTDPAWYSEKAKLEDGYEIGAGRRTATINPTDAELAEMERLQFEALPKSVQNELSRLRAENERLTADVAEAQRETGHWISENRRILKAGQDAAYALEASEARALATEAREAKAATLLTKASVALEQFAAIGDMLSLAGATSKDEVEISGEELRPALIAAAQIKKEIDASLLSLPTEVQNG